MFTIKLERKTPFKGPPNIKAGQNVRKIWANRTQNVGKPTIKRGKSNEKIRANG